jgi:DNA-damage-inducible protein J
MRKGIPFELRIPNEETRNAINELESGKGKKFATFKEMLEDELEDD